MTFSYKFGTKDVILAYVLLPFLVVYWVAVYIWHFHFTANARREDINEMRRKLI